MQHCLEEHLAQLAEDCLPEHPEQGGLTKSNEFARRRTPYCWMMTTSGAAALTLINTAFVGEIM